MPRGGKQIQFDMNLAEKTKNDLDSEIKEIKKSFAKLSEEIDATHDWWQGQSQKTFVKIYEQHQEEVLNAINEWLKKYGELVMEYGKAYKDADAAIFG